MSFPTWAHEYSEWWFTAAAEHGVPIVIPCTVEGDRATLSCAVSREDPDSLPDQPTSPCQRVRLAYALEACRRGYIEARRLGAEVLIP